MHNSQHTHTHTRTIPKAIPIIQYPNVSPMVSRWLLGRGILLGWARQTHLHTHPAFTCLGGKGRKEGGREFAGDKKVRREGGGGRLEQIDFLVLSISGGGVLQGGGGRGGGEKQEKKE